MKKYLFYMFLNQYLREPIFIFVSLCNKLKQFIFNNYAFELNLIWKNHIDNIKVLYILLTLIEFELFFCIKKFYIGQFVVSAIYDCLLLLLLLLVYLK